MAKKTSTKTKSATGAIALLVGTRKGAFVIHGDKTRRSWKDPVGMHIGSIVHHMVMDPRDRRTILMTAHTGHLGPTIFQSTDLGKTWKEATKPPAFPKAPEGQKGLSVNHNFWLTPGHKSEPRVWYVGTSPAGLFRSEDDGMTWEGVTGFNNHPKYNPLPREDETPPDGQTLHSIMIDPRDPKHMYIGLSSGASGVFETKDQGKDWIPLTKGFSGLDEYGIPADSETGQEPHCMRISAVNPDRLYQQSHMGVYRMDRADAVWKRIGENLPKEHGISDYSFPIALHPRDPDTVWLFPLDGGFPLGRITPDGMPATYITRNGGKTWKRQDKGLPKGDGWFSLKRQAMTTDSRDPVGVYFGTTGGEVWASRDEGASWTQIANSLPEIYSVEVAEFAP
ncbi:MAG: glycosyl hydrolase [Chloroflexota bacterium]|nr:glycosyl hydrolase [Chloroflexota bacterium]